MDKKTTSIITVIATTLLCGVPGFIGICMSLIAFVGMLFPDPSIAQDDVMVIVASSIMTLGLSLVCAVIPIGVSVWALWSYRKEQASIEQTVIPEEDF
jgi:O-antigen/teichoic acid export membrane protein